jgi:hypothetical protein
MRYEGARRRNKSARGIAAPPHVLLVRRTKIQGKTKKKMKKIAMVLLAFALAAANADTQTNVRRRGTSAAVDGDTMRVHGRDGRDLQLELADDLTVAAAKALTLFDLKPATTSA